MSEQSSKPVLVPSPAGEGRELVARLRELGHEVDHAPFVELRMNRDSDAKHAVAALMEGRFTQLVLEGPRAVDLVLSYADLQDARDTGGNPSDGESAPASEDPDAPGRPVLALPRGTEITAIGEDTAAALAEVGLEPTRTVPALDAGAGLEVPAASREGEELLLITSATAPASLTGQLQQAGYAVTRVTGYRPVPVGLDPQVVRDLRLAGYSSVALPGTFLADLAGHLGIHRDIRVVTLHAGATKAAEARSLVVHGQATEPTGAALAEAIDRAVAGS